MSAAASLIYYHPVLDLATNVQYVKGIGPHFAEILLDKGISTVEDLLYYLPFRYEDRLNPRGIGELAGGRDGQRDCRGPYLRAVSHPPHADL